MNPATCGRGRAALISGSWHSLQLSRQAARQLHELFRHERRPRQGRQPRRACSARIGIARCWRTAAGAGSKTWHAYLSENGSAGHPTINARDRDRQRTRHNAKRRAHREQRRRSPQRQEQHQQDDRA